MRKDMVRFKLHSRDRRRDLRALEGPVRGIARGVSSKGQRRLPWSHQDSHQQDNRPTHNHTQWWGESDISRRDRELRVFRQKTEEV